MYWKNEKKDFFSIWGKFFNVSLKNIFYKYFDTYTYSNEVNHFNKFGN